MKRIVLILAFCLTCDATVFPQRMEYGKPSELRGVTKIFVGTEGDLEIHDRLVEEIKKQLPALEITDRREDAEVIVGFSQESGSGPYIHSAVGSGSVMKRVWEGRVRLILQWRGSKRNIFQKEPVRNFAQEFAKAYRKANGIKEK